MDLNPKETAVGGGHSSLVEIALEFGIFFLVYTTTTRISHLGVLCFPHTSLPVSSVLLLFPFLTFFSPLSLFFSSSFRTLLTLKCCC